MDPGDEQRATLWHRQILGPEDDVGAQSSCHQLLGAEHQLAAARTAGEDQAIDIGLLRPLSLEQIFRCLPYFFKEIYRQVGSASTCSYSSHLAGHQTLKLNKKKKHK
jgi:hypothetical protein